MNEADARRWLAARVPRETIERLTELVSLIVAETSRQNLIAASTIDSIWSRHIVDSAQLLALAPVGGRWLDLGSGAGFPGLVIALAGPHHVTLTESRSRRSAFLRDAIALLSLGTKVSLLGGPIERLPADMFDVVSARAFAPLERLFATAEHLAGPRTRWVLPKGRSAQAELDAARGSWQGSFRVEPSITDPDAAIIVADHVRRAGGRRIGSTP